MTSQHPSAWSCNNRPNQAHKQSTSPIYVTNRKFISTYPQPTMSEDQSTHEPPPPNDLETETNGPVIYNNPYPNCIRIKSIAFNPHLTS